MMEVSRGVVGATFWIKTAAGSVLECLPVPTLCPPELSPGSIPIIPVIPLKVTTHPTRIAINPDPELS